MVTMALLFDQDATLKNAKYHQETSYFVTLNWAGNQTQDVRGVN